MFFQIFIAMLLGLTSPSNSTCTNQGDTPVTTLEAGGPGPGGDTGQLPPPKIN